MFVIKRIFRIKTYTNKEGWRSSTPPEIGDGFKRGKDE
jgi:hypothetical protein